MNNTAVNTKFQVKTEKFGNQQLLKLFNQNTGEFVSILPETGGMLHSLELLIGGKLISVFDSYKTEEELLQTLGNSFKGSNLFPFPNRIDNGTYEFQSKKHQLHVNFPHENNAIHGLVFDKKFDVIEFGASENAAWTKLKFCSDGDLKGYPFKFILEIIFELSDRNGLTVITSYTNTDTTTIPVAQGWHPYIQLQSSVDTFKFSFPAIKTFEVNEKMIPTGKTYEYGLFEEPALINDTFFDSCFEVKNTGKNAEISIFDPALNDGVTIWQETGDCKYNFLQIYTPPSRKTIAIEPMTSIPNALNNNIGLCSLAPKQSIKVSWGLKKGN